MASGVCCKAASIVSSPRLSSLRRRLPFVGAFCFLSLGLTNLAPSLSSSSSSNIIGSIISSNKGIHSGSNSSAMEGSSSSSVPSIVVYVTVPNKEAGKKLAESIVKAKLAACVNRVPGIESVYEWKGEIQTDYEELLIIKTRKSLLDALTDHVKANHEYEVPEVIALPITGGNVPYLEWIKNNTRE